MGTKPFESAPNMLTGSDPCGIGKFRETPLQDVPMSFFEWIRREEAMYPRLWRGERWLAVIIYLNHNNILVPEKK
jgi:hypothetical protein